MDNRYGIAEQNGMSREFADWFFNNKKAGCGNVWFMMMAAMWEGWQGRAEMFKNCASVKPSIDAGYVTKNPSNCASVKDHQITASMAKWIALKLGAELNDEEADVFADGYNAALQSFGNPEQLEPVSQPYKLPPNSFTDAELEAMAHGDNPQANAYRELLAFRRNSPVTQDGWVLVPVEPTPDMREAYHQAQAEYEDADGLWCPDHQWQAMLAAAPQQEGEY